MEPLFIILILATVLLIILAFKLIRSLIKASLVAFLIIIIIATVTGLVIVSDAKEFVTTFRNESTTYILVDDGEIITGFQAKRFNLTTYDVVSDNDLEDHLEEPIFLGKTIIVEQDVLNTTFEEIDIDLLLSSNSQNLQAQGFAVAFAHTIKSEGPLYISKQLKKGTIQILPRTVIVRFISTTPTEFVKELVSDLEFPSLQQVDEEEQEDE